MSDLDKILDFLEYDDTEKSAKNQNPLLKAMAEYINSILLYLGEDIKKEKIQVLDDRVEVNRIMVKISNYNVKCKMFNRHEVEHFEQIVPMVRKLFQNESIKDYINAPSFYKRHRIKKYDVKMLHAKVCKDMFRKMGEDSYKNSEMRLWISIAEEEEILNPDNITAEGRRSIKLEMISSDILEYDRYIFEKLRQGPDNIVEMIKEFYRPYFVEYYIDTEELKEKQMDFLQQMVRENGWYRAALADEAAETDAEEEFVFKGVFVHSASPVEYEHKKLVIQDARFDRKVQSDTDDIYKVEDIQCAADTDVQMKLKKLFNGVSFERTRVYRAGNGNCIYNYGKKGRREKRFFYDIGFDMRVHLSADPKALEKEYRGALKDIRNSKPHCIILSHWDEDHFRGCAYANRNIFNIPWIVPGIKKSEKKLNARRLMIYLYILNNLMVIKRGDEREIVIDHQINGKLVLYTGIRRAGTDRKITACNCEGIAVYIENDMGKSGKIRCLMQGDVPYKSLPERMNFAAENPYEYLVVPHHGAKMNLDLLTKSEKKDGQAVICCTNELVKNRPAENHLNKLKKCYNNVKTTAQAKCYIQLNLKKKNDMNLC
ncbi:MAG: hypothetical protein J6O72_06500 [Lachnospira sp.]|nr:hypothetical protein [Lachnospira sp.]